MTSLHGLHNFVNKLQKRYCYPTLDFLGLSLLTNLLTLHSTTRNTETQILGTNHERHNQLQQVKIQSRQCLHPMAV